ncbi:MAG: RES family NAD+ phosphorylase [Flavitalea sp.]
MLVYRIVRSKNRTGDLSGTGAFNYGGRWNQEGTYALYTSENPSLALLELLVHAEETELPALMFLMTIEISDSVSFYEFPDTNLPDNWRIPENIELKEKGSALLKENKFFGIKARSAVLINQYNYILNPQFPNYHNLIKVIKVEPLEVDKRLARKE